jgi:hypothetical protein
MLIGNFKKGGLFGREEAVSLEFQVAQAGIGGATSCKISDHLANGIHREEEEMQRQEGRRFSSVFAPLEKTNVSPVSQKGQKRRTQRKNNSLHEWPIG